jgi:hypothetical protein
MLAEQALSGLFDLLMALRTERTLSAPRGPMCRIARLEASTARVEAQIRGVLEDLCHPPAAEHQVGRNPAAWTNRRCHFAGARTDAQHRRLSFWRDQAQRGADYGAAAQAFSLRWVAFYEQQIQSIRHGDGGSAGSPVPKPAG